MSTLIEVATSASAKFVGLGVGKDVKDFVFWRYRIDQASSNAKGEWTLWTTSEVETFTLAKTTIVLEAWTPCGIVSPPFAFTLLLRKSSSEFGVSSYGAFALLLSSASASLVSASKAHPFLSAVLVFAACPLAALAVLIVVRKRRQAMATDIDLDTVEGNLIQPLLE